MRYISLFMDVYIGRTLTEYRVNVPASPSLERGKPMLNTMFTQGSKFQSINNHEESVMPITGFHMSIDEMFKDVSTNKEEGAVVHTTEEKKGFLLDEIIDWEPTFAHFTALKQRDYEEGEMHRLRKMELDAKEGLAETDRMIFTFFGRKFNSEGKFDASLLDDGKDRNKGVWGTKTQMAMAWRAKVAEFRGGLEWTFAVKQAEIRENNRTFTQERQWEAQCDIMQGAYERKMERQAKHQARIEKMKAKKVDGKTPKQVKRTKRFIEVPVVTIPNIVLTFGIKSITGVVSFKFNCVATTKKGEPCKNTSKDLGQKKCHIHRNEVFMVNIPEPIIKKQKEVKITTNQAKKVSIAATKDRNNLTQGLKFRALIEANIKDHKIITQGAKMRNLVSTLMTNKEV